jgi:hypothetical protein
MLRIPDIWYLIVSPLTNTWLGHIYIINNNTNIQDRGSSFWPAPFTRIKTEALQKLYPSVYTDKAISGFDLQTHFPYLAIYSDGIS